jgi:hypothetical protein
MFWTCRFYKTQFCKQIMLSCVIKFEICESIFFTHFKFVSESMFYNDDGFFINIRYNDHMLDPLGLLMIILFCKHLIYTSKHNMDHFSPFRMGFSQGILCSISWWSHIKTTSNNQFWKKYSKQLKKSRFVFENHLVSWKKTFVSQNKTSCGICA